MLPHNRKYYHRFNSVVEPHDEDIMFGKRIDRFLTRFALLFVGSFSIWMLAHLVFFIVRGGPVR
jgi:hypothetical protein